MLLRKMFFSYGCFLRNESNDVVVCRLVVCDIFVVTSCIVFVYVCVYDDRDFLTMQGQKN